MKVYVALLVAMALVAMLLPSGGDAMPRRRGGKRQGRTGDGLDAPPAPDAEAGGEGGEGSDVPAWCDPAVEMGAWMNFDKIRKWCADNGFTDFGPYGGVPAEEGGEEAEEK